MPFRYLLCLLCLLPSSPLQAQVPAHEATLDSTKAATIEAAARALELKVSTGHPETLAEWFDSDAFLDRANEDRQIGALIMSELRLVHQDGSEILSAIIDQLREGGQLRFLRIIERDGEDRARFRILSPQSGINYHDMLLVPDSSGAARLLDSFVFVSGEDLSDTIGRLMEMMAAESVYSPRVLAYSTFFDHFNAERFRDAWNTFPADHLDEANKKALMLIRTQLATRVGDREYQQALLDFAEAFPSDPSLALILIDVHFNTGDFEAMVETIDQLDASVGGDPYLGVFRGIAHLQTGRPKDALEQVRGALKAEPALLVPNVIEFQALVALERFEEAAATMARMTGYGYALDPATIEADPANAAFVLSKPYRAWRDEMGP